MKIIKITILFSLIFFLTDLKAQSIDENYTNAFNEIKSMLQDEKPISFKNAVFLTENAYHKGTLSYEAYINEIDFLKKMSLLIIGSRQLLYDEADKKEIEKLASIFTLITDSIPVLMDTDTVYHLPYTYDFKDIWGQQDWSKMFVSKLLDTHAGNCHSLPYLYKILSDELGVKSYLSLAPNHIYIKSYSKKSGWYNTELTSANFPIDAWLMASGYIHLAAIQNGIYLDTLSDKQNLALCLVDLAQGYKKKYGINNIDFILECTYTALKYYPNYVNALLTRSETQKEYISNQVKINQVEYPKDLFYDVKIKNMFEEMEQTYIELYKLGYRQMPERMYIDWLVSLQKEKEKYVNNKINY